MIAVSQKDAELATATYGASNVQVVDNGVDVQRYRHNGTHRNPMRMIFLGSLDWRPNLDGLDRFVKTAFPQIVAAEPTASLEIVGRNPPDWLVNLADNHPRIELHANVPDVIPHLSSAGIMIVPLRIGGGSRLKIIEAAANGLPVVSTRIGAEGLKFSADHDYFLAAGIEQMADPVLTAMRQQESSKRMADNALQLVEKEYDWNALANIQADIWNATAAGTQ
jgi:glycosyltransferase involved in cell wall biosynthesis